MTESTETQQPPQQESRLKKTLLNARVNFGYYFVVLILSFYSRKVFLDGLGDTFVGLTGTVAGVLSMLNMAELGINSAITYVLYKPLYDKDQNKINEIVSVIGFLYRFVGGFILVGGVIASFFFPWFFPESETGYSLLLTYCIFYSFLLSSLIGYFINYRAIVLHTDQKAYVVTVYFQGAGIAKTLCQMASAWWLPQPINFYSWIAIEMVFGIASSVVLNYKINSTYPWLKSNVKAGRKALKQYPEITKYIKQIFVHRIATFVQFESTNMLIYAYVSVGMVAYYYNYMTILNRVSALVGNFLGSTAAGVGNLVAEGNIPKAMRVYWEMFTFEQFMTTIICFMFFVLADPFITIWLGSKYILGLPVLLLIVANFFMLQTRGTTLQFMNAYGLFYDVWAPLTESALFIGFSMLGGHFYGLPGVLSGSFVSQLIIIWGWKPIFLFSKGFKVSVWRYFGMLLRYYTLTAISACSTILIYRMLPLEDAATSVWAWITSAVIYGILFVSILYCLYLAFLPGMKALTIRLLRLVRIDERKLGLSA